MDQFWMCYVDGYRMPKKRHDSLESARKEANRLASEHPSRAVYVMCIESSVAPTVERKVIDRTKKEPVLPKVSVKKRRIVAIEPKCLV